jgi:hypothetical protein
VGFDWDHGDVFRKGHSSHNEKVWDVHCHDMHNRAGLARYRQGVVGCLECMRAQNGTIAGYRIKPVRLGDAQLRQYCIYASSGTRNQIITPQTELNGVVLCPELSSLLLS